MEEDVSTVPNTKLKKRDTSVELSAQKSFYWRLANGQYWFHFFAFIPGGTVVEHFIMQGFIADLNIPLARFIGAQ